MAVTTKNLFRPSGQDTLKSVERQRQMAAALQGQAMQPLRGQMAGRTYVGASGLEGAGKLAQMLAGTYVQGQADDREKQIEADQRQAFMTDMNAYQDAIKGTPAVAGSPETNVIPPQGVQGSETNPYIPASGEFKEAVAEQAAIPGMDRGQAAMQYLMNSNSPMAQKIGVDLYGKSLETPEDYTLKQGDVRLSGGNKEIARGLPKDTSSSMAKLLSDLKKYPKGSPERLAILANIKKSNYITPPSATNVNVSVGGNQADKDYASQFVDWTTGSFADTMKGLDQLKLASKELGEDATLTGAGKGLIPDPIRAFTNPKALSNKNKVEEVVQRNLRVILGAQFTEKEGVRLIERAYNPDLPVKENKRRVDALIKQIETAAKAKNEAAKYFRIHRTLDGFEGMLPTKEDFNPDVVYQAAPQSERSPETQAIMDIYK